MALFGTKWPVLSRPPYQNPNSRNELRHITKWAGTLAPAGSFDDREMEACLGIASVDRLRHLLRIDKRNDHVGPVSMRTKTLLRLLLQYSISMPRSDRRRSHNRNAMPSGELWLWRMTSERAKKWHNVATFHEVLCHFACHF